MISPWSFLLLILLQFNPSQGKVSLYLSSDQTKALYGIQTDGLYYVRDGMVNKYAMTFQHQTIPAEVDHIDFSWRAQPHTAVPYKITFIHTPGPAMDPPTVNVSMAGLVPTYLDKFRLFFPCTGKVAAEVDTLLQLSLAIGPGEPEILNFKRRKICKEKTLPAEELISDTSSTTPSQSVLLASVSPTMFVAMGAASASVLLVAVLIAAVYLRRLKKRGQQLNNEGSLRSSMHLHSEVDYMEKPLPNPNLSNLSSSDSYATLASFSPVPVYNPEAPGWARFSSPSVTEYSVPLTKSPVPRSSKTAHPSPAPARSGRPSPYASSMGSLHTSLVYDSNKPRIMSHFTPLRTRTRVGGYENCDRLPRTTPVYPDYEYSTPGEASPYSVSSELYKHVMPQYFHFSRPASRGSVLV